MRPSAPPLLFWKLRASTTCSRVTLPILVRMRPSGRPLSSSTETGPAGAVGAWRVPGVTIFAPGAGAAGAGAAPAPVGAAGLPLPPGETTLFAGCPPAVGGALAPISGALGVVTFG